MDNYWDRTIRILQEHGGKGPPCPLCGEEMFPADDHGRFFCRCGQGSFDAMLPGQTIPQVNTTGMTDAQKAKIPPINRLYVPGTAAENRVEALAAQGPECMNDPKYWDAVREEEKEREGK